MGYYHIKNIKIDRKNNNISADLADSNIYPKTYYHIDSLNDKGSFKEKYANFIYIKRTESSSSTPQLCAHFHHG